MSSERYDINNYVAWATKLSDGIYDVSIFYKGSDLERFEVITVLNPMTPDVKVYYDTAPEVTGCGACDDEELDEVPSIKLAEALCAWFEEPPWT